MYTMSRKLDQVRESVKRVEVRLCKCGCGEYFGAEVKRRPPEYAGPDHRRRALAARKKAQRHAAKENEVGKPSADPVVVGYSNHTPAGSASQPPAKKTTRQSSVAPLSLGRGFGGSAPDWYEQRWSQICFGYVPVRLPW